MYTCKYCSKGPAEKNHATAIFFAVDKQTKKRKSVAENAGTPERDFQFMVTRINNLYGRSMEYHDTQAAAKLLGIESEYKSHKFWYFSFDALCLIDDISLSFAICAR